MSGSGGYYRYHCKNWMTYDCPNWVWQNNTPCATCMANGRDAEDRMPTGWIRAKWAGPVTWERKLPLTEHGAVRYFSAEELAAREVHSTPVDADSEFKPARQLA